MVIGIIASVPVTVSAMSLDDFKFELNADGTSYTVFGNNRYMRGEILIPDTYKGLPVTDIGDYAFYGYTDTTSIVISNSIINIGECAFSECCFAESIVIGDNVKNIGNEAFAWCSSATTIVMGNSIESLGDKVFLGCQDLQGISLPASLKKIGLSPFYCCYSFDSIEIPAENKYFSSVDGVLYDKKHTKVLQYPIAKPETTYTVLDGVTTITENAFLCAQYVEEIILPDSVTKIGDCAFSNCENLTYITIPNSLKSLGEAAFEDCEKLKSISLPDDCTLSDFAFCGCSSLEYANIPENEYYIPQEVFADCVNLKKINIPKDTWRIWIDAFRNCKSLTSITIPVGIEMIGNGAFSGCENLKKVNFSGTREQWEEMEIFADNEPLLNAYYSNSVPATPKLASISCVLTGVKVSWVKAAGVGEYIVYRKTSKTGWTRLGTTTSTSFTDKTAKSGTTYYYTVKAQNGAGASGYNKTGLAIKYIAAPKLSKVYNNGAGNVLSWGKVTGASGYYVYRKTPSSGWKKIATIKKGTIASYTDKKVTYGSSYIYTVKAYSGKTVSAYNTTGIKIIKKLPNVTITTKNVTGGKRVYLSSSVSGATIYYKTSKDGSYKKYTGDFGLTSTKTIYAYAVRASYYKSSTASKKVVVTKAKTPTISVANCVGGKKITLKSDTPGATVYYKTSKDGSYVKYTEPFVVSSTKTVYAKTYAKGYATSSTTSKAVSVSKIGTPTGLTVKSYASTSTKINWKKVSGAQGYYIYRATEKDGTYTLVHKITSGSTVAKTDTGLNPSTAYYYKVRAYCSGKATSSYCGAVGAKTTATPTSADAEKYFNNLVKRWDCEAFNLLYTKDGKFGPLDLMYICSSVGYIDENTKYSNGKTSFSNVMTQTEFNKYKKLLSVGSFYKVYKISDIQKVLDDTWAPGRFSAKALADGEYIFATSKGYLLAECGGIGDGYVGYETQVKSCERSGNKYIMEVYIIEQAMFGKNFITDYSSGESLGTLPDDGTVKNFDEILDALGITVDSLETTTVVLVETSSGLRLESITP